MNVTKEQVGQAIDVVRALAEAIRTSKQIPSGHLYAMVVGSMDLATYNGAIGLLKRAGLVAEKGNALTWIGPELEGAGQ